MFAGRRRVDAKCQAASHGTRAGQVRMWLERAGLRNLAEGRAARAAIAAKAAYTLRVQRHQGMRNQTPVSTIKRSRHMC